MRTTRICGSRGGVWSQGEYGTRRGYGPGGGIGFWSQIGWGYGPRGRDYPPVNRLTDACKNITFPQLRLRAVIINSITEFIKLKSLFYWLWMESIQCYLLCDIEKYWKCLSLNFLNLQLCPENTYYITMSGEDAFLDWFDAHPPDRQSSTFIFYSVIIFVINVSGQTKVRHF